MSQNRKMPTHAAVFHHWRQRGWKGANKRVCMMCNWEAKDGNIIRAHIVARCNGGADAVENLFLACDLCHVVFDGWTLGALEKTIIPQKVMA